MNAENRIDGLRKLIREKCQENDEHAKILSQYESYRIKFLENIEKLMEPAHSFFSTDSDSDSYDEESSESMPDENYGAPTRKNKKMSSASDMNLDSNDYWLKQKKLSSAHSSPQLNKISSANFSQTLSTPQKANKSPLQTKSQPQPRTKTNSKQSLDQKIFQNMNQMQNLNYLMSKIFSETVRKAQERAAQNKTPSSSVTLQKSQSAPTTNKNIYFRKEQNPAREIKHPLMPPRSVLTTPPQKFPGTIPGQYIMNEMQNVYSFGKDLSNTKGTFTVGDSKVASLIAKYRKTFELLQQQQFINLLHQKSLSQMITLDIVETAYKLIYQNSLNCKNIYIRDRCEMSEQNPEISSYLKMVAKNRNDKGLRMIHMDLLESKLSLWSKINQKTPGQFIVQFSEVIKPSETINLMDNLDIQSLKSNKKINQDFKVTDESDAPMYLDE